jgi:hypothetical protein
MSAEHLFKVKAVLLVTRSVNDDAMRQVLEAFANEMMVELRWGAATARPPRRDRRATPLSRRGRDVLTFGNRSRFTSALFSPCLTYCGRTSGWSVGRQCRLFNEVQP